MDTTLTTTPKTVALNNGVVYTRTADLPTWRAYTAVMGIPLAGALLGAILGIVVASRDQVGPALALWITSMLSLVSWVIVAALVVVAQIVGAG
jgi:hypothetical protein